MRTIEIIRIELVNFKGQKNTAIDFTHNTDIFGKNESGKTTIFDAVCWVLFGKDSQDRKDFELKPLDANNNVIEKLDHEVNATFLINGEKVVLRKILKERWVKKKGAPLPEFIGNTIEHYWNDVPLATAREYQEKVNLICDENVFKLITNPASFMALKWQDRREVLIKIADKKSDTELANGNRDFEKLFLKLSNNKTLEEFSKEIQASIKKAKDDLKAIPTRIDEVVRSKAEGLDFKQIENQLESKKELLQKVEDNILNKSGMFDTEIAKNNEAKTKANLLKNSVEVREVMLKSQAKKKVADQSTGLTTLKAKIVESKANITTAENGVETLRSKVEFIGKEILETTAKIDAKRADWYAENGKKLTFENECFDCPTCKRAFEAGDIVTKKAELEKTFIANKQASLETITNAAKSLQTISENQQKEIDALNVRIANGNKHITTLKEDLLALENELKGLETNFVPLVEVEVLAGLIAGDDSLAKMKADIVEIEAGLVVVPEIDYAELAEEKKTLIESIAELNKKLQLREQIKIADNRIKQLQAEEVILSQQILDVERTQFIIDNFNRVKIEHLENSINTKLQTVKFKMFEQQINGGEQPCCEALLDGVPYSNVNTAGRLNIGLDIINMLCEYYQVNAPIIIDNRESVTDIIECQSQIINLVVSPGDEVLRVESKLGVEF